MLWHKLFGFAVLSLALTQMQFTKSVSAAVSCTNSFTLVDNLYCFKANNALLTFYEADRYCRSQGGGLVSLANQAKLTSINKWMATALPRTSEFWTSGNTLGQKGAYYWQSTGERATYLPWATGQPQANNGDCLSCSTTNVASPSYLLTIRNCTLYLPSACELPTRNIETRICLKPASYENSTVLV